MCLNGTFCMYLNAAWKRECQKKKGAEEPCRVKQERKRGRMKEGGRERSCSISSTGEHFKALKLHPGLHRPGGPRLHGSPFPVCD